MKSILFFILFFFFSFSILAQKKSAHVSEKLIKQILEAIPHPVEMASTIVSIDQNFPFKGLHSPKRVNEYRNVIKQSLNMGVYHADLEFMIMMRSSEEIVHYVDVVKRLSILLEIEDWLEYNFMKDLSQNTTLYQTMLEISQRNFENINEHLQRKSETHLNALVITGAWIETMFLASQVYQKSKNAVLRERIAEQKIALDGITLLLKTFSNRHRFKNITDDMLHLKELYKQVSINTEYGESKMIEKNGELIIELQNTTTATVSEADLEKIIQGITILREKVID